MVLLKKTMVRLKKTIRVVLLKKTMVRLKKTIKSGLIEEDHGQIEEDHKSGLIEEDHGQIEEDHIQDQQPAMRLISSLQIKSTKGLLPAIIFLNLNQV